MNGITATAVAPSFLAAVSARPPDALPKAWFGITMTLKPSRRRPRDESSTMIDNASTSSASDAMRKGLMWVRFGPLRVERIRAAK
jgi:hypothetical protein